MHVVAQIDGIDKAGRRPRPIGVGHGDGCDVPFIDDNGIGQPQAYDLLIGLADPMETRRRITIIADIPGRSGRDKGEASRPHDMLLACKRKAE